MRNFFIFILSFVAVFPVIEAENYTEYVEDLEQVTGGSPVPYVEYLELHSHIVAIRNTENNTLCTGAIVGPHEVLTAAHCLENDNFEIENPKREILVGAKVLGYDTQKISMSEYRVHPNYTPAFADIFDLAILVVKEDWPSYVKPAELITRSEFEKHKTAASEFISLSLAGFGALQTYSNNWSNELRSVNKRVALSRVKENDIIVDQRDGFGTCVGDSGGPAILALNGKKKIVAVVSTLNFPHNKEKEKCSYDSILSIVFRDMLNAKFEWIMKK